LRLCFDEFELDETNARLTREGRPVPVPPKAFAVLCTLARQPGQLITKNALLDAVWGHQHISESVLKTVISELRAALSDDARQPRYIETASRRGYRFIGSTRPEQAPPAGAAERAQPALSPAIFADRPRSQSLIGRQIALERLHRAWADALEGRRKIFWVTGEAGVGKTTLIEGFSAENGTTTACDLIGRCLSQWPNRTNGSRPG